jgi:hypothetical protein
MSKRERKRCDWNYHHRKPKSLGGSGRITSPNLIHVPVVKHRAWHTLFETKTPQEIAAIINKTWLDNDWEMIAVRKGENNG